MGLALIIQLNAFSISRFLWFLPRNKSNGVITFKREIKIKLLSIVFAKLACYVSSAKSFQNIKQKVF